MAESSGNIIVRFFKAVWQGLDLLRRSILNLLLLLIIIVIISAVIQGGESALPREHTALVLAPQGRVVEQYSGSPADRVMAQMSDQPVEETRLRDILRAIRLAKTDDNIERIVIVPDHMTGIGPAQLNDIAQALDDFRESGKQVFAWGNAMSQGQYMLAVQADEIWLHPEGFLLLQGFARYRNYFKEGLDKLGVDVHLFKVGTFKSAAEPWIRNDMSEPARKANQYWMGDLWSQAVTTIAQRRKLDPAALNPDLDRMIAELKKADGNFATLALNLGLVDKLATREEMRQQLKTLGAPQDDDRQETFRQVFFMDYLKAHPRLPLPGDKIGIVVAQGAITGGDQPPGTVGGESTSRLLRNARYDDDIKAVVLRVDSPGGGVFASEQIREEVVRLKEAGKPVIVSMGTVAASGGYWISMNADEIWAQPNTITGSIGIFGLLMNYPETLGKLGIHTDGVATTELAGAFRPDLPFNDKFGELVQLNIERGYRNFIGKVAEARGKTPEEIDAIAQGRVWTGSQALDRGLVDKLGSLRDAVNAAVEKAGLGEDAYQITYVEPELSDFDRFIMDLTGQGLALLGIQLPNPLADLPANRVEELRRALKLFMGPQRDPMGMYAHCLCTVD